MYRHKCTHENSIKPVVRRASKFLVGSAILFATYLSFGQDTIANLSAFKQLDCGLRAHGNPNNYYVTDGKVKVRIPSRSATQTKDGGAIEIRTAWSIHGAKVVRLRLPFDIQEVQRSKNSWESYSKSGNQVLEGNIYNILFASDGKTLVDTLRRVFGERLDAVGVDGRQHITLVDELDTPAIDGNHLIEWDAIRETSQVVYICATTARPAY